jgi:hypothetical protein
MNILNNLMQCPFDLYLNLFFLINSFYFNLYVVLSYVTILYLTNFESSMNFMNGFFYC